MHRLGTKRESILKCLPTSGAMGLEWRSKFIRLDMTHVTKRVGSPPTLVCTKDWRTFARRTEQYQLEVAAMRTLLGPALSWRRRSVRANGAVKRAAEK